MDFIAGLSEWGYIGLFIAGFLAGSILPFSSEVVLGLLLYAGYNEWGCLASATAGKLLLAGYAGQGRMDREISAH